MGFLSLLSLLSLFSDRMQSGTVMMHECEGGGNMVSVRSVPFLEDKRRKKEEKRKEEISFSSSLLPFS
jgi:hypothetical protein